MLFNVGKYFDNLKLWFSDYFGQDKHYNVFLDTLSGFIRKFKNADDIDNVIINIDNIEEFINEQKNLLSNIENGTKDLLSLFIDICVFQTNDDVDNFLKLTDKLGINKFHCVSRILSNLQRQILNNNNGKKLAMDFFPTPKDLFMLYEKLHPRFFDDKFENIINAANNYWKAKISNFYKGNGDHFFIFYLFEKCDGKLIANFIKLQDKQDNRNNINQFVNAVIWVSFFDYSVAPYKIREIFPTIKDLIDFYIYKVPEQLKNKEQFSIFYFLQWHAYTTQDFVPTLEEWDNYSNNISDDKHIELFFNFFEGKIKFDSKYYLTEIIDIRRMFCHFKNIQGFLDFYLKIYSKHKDCLKNENTKRDQILNCITGNYGRDVNNFLLINGDDEKYIFFIPRLIDLLCEYRYLAIQDFSDIAQFLDKNINLDKNLKNKLLDKINNRVVECIKNYFCRQVKYLNHTFIYPESFETNLNRIASIMRSKNVFPAIKEEICKLAKTALEKDQKQWQYVLNMCMKMIQQAKSSDKNSPSLQKYSITFDDVLDCDYWYLADQENSTELQNLNDGIDTHKNKINNLDNQIQNLNTQINDLENYLSKTEFQFEWNWNLFVWISGIGTIVRLVRRYFWNKDLLTFKDQINVIKDEISVLENNKNEKDEENKIKNEKNDYNDSLSKAKKQMEEWGKHKQSKSRPYDEHKKYCEGLQQIIDIYEQQQNQDIKKQNLGKGIPSRQFNNNINGIMDIN